MRKVVSLVLMGGLAACAPLSRWEKAGVSDQVIVNDMKECRAAAAQEAFSYYPSGIPPFWGFRRGGYLFWQQRQDSERFYAENRLTAFCMRNKGYELVPIQPPQTQAPAPPASPQPKE